MHPVGDNIVEKAFRKPLLLDLYLGPKILEGTTIESGTHCYA
jgi:hypothetical protein